MIIHTYHPHALQPLTESHRTVLTVEMGNHHTAHIQSSLREYITQAQHVLIIGDAKVATHLIALDILRTDDNDNLGIITQLHEHAQLAVGMETG